MVTFTVPWLCIEVGLWSHGATNLRELDTILQEEGILLALYAEASAYKRSFGSH